MYWIQEYGSGTGANRSNFKFFHCDFREDINHLPTNTKLGVQENTDANTLALCHPGDQCLCLEDSSVWELGSIASDSWKNL